METPTLTASKRIALADLKLDQLSVVYPDTRSYELGPQAKAIPLVTIAAEGIDSFVPARRSPSRAKRPPSNARPRTVAGLERRG
jgi:hypothetical protein